MGSASPSVERCQRLVETPRTREQCPNAATWRGVLHTDVFTICLWLGDQHVVALSMQSPSKKREANTSLRIARLLITHAGDRRSQIILADSQVSALAIASVLWPSRIRRLAGCSRRRV